MQFKERAAAEFLNRENLTWILKIQKTEYNMKFKGELGIWNT